MEQPESNPTFCTNNCGFYGSSQFEGMCSKCYRDHVSRSLNPERTDTFPNYYNNNNESSSTAPTIRDDQDEMVGRMDEDNLPQPSAPTTSTASEAATTVTPKMENDDDELDQREEQNSESPADPTSSLTRVVSAPTMPMTISRNIDIPVKNDSAISLSVMETSSLGANSMSPLTASSVDKKKRNRCSWQSCNKKLGLTGFDCRCGGQFCPIHRYANEHQCTFDYKEHGQNEIRKNMPVVQADRVRRI